MDSTMKERLQWKIAGKKDKDKKTETENTIQKLKDKSQNYGLSRNGAWDGVSVNKRLVEKGESHKSAAAEEWLTVTVSVPAHYQDGREKQLITYQCCDLRAAPWVPLKLYFYWALCN